jgi:ComF family protein
LRVIKEFISIVYPNICSACDRPLSGGELAVCSKCRSELPRTGYHLMPENPVTLLFAGKSHIGQATSLLFFRKGGHIQQMLHKLKYEGRSDVGYALGLMLAEELRHAPDFGDVDLIAPVPLHPRKLHLRGFNQAALIAEGMAVGLHKTHARHLLRRTRHVASQTRKNVWERFKNVAEIFEVSEPNTVRGKKILLVDDVITTGATLSQCANAVLAIPDTQVSVASAAIAR